MSQKTPTVVAHGDDIGAEISLHNFDGKQGFALAQGQ